MHSIQTSSSHSNLPTKKSSHTHTQNTFIKIHHHCEWMAGNANNYNADKKKCMEYESLTLFHFPLIYAINLDILLFGVSFFPHFSTFVPLSRSRRGDFFRFCHRNHIDNLEMSVRSKPLPWKCYVVSVVSIERSEYRSQQTSSHHKVEINCCCCCQILGKHCMYELCVSYFEFIPFGEHSLLHDIRPYFSMFFFHYFFRVCLDFICDWYETYKQQHP